MEDGINMSLSTDDPTIFQSSLCDDYTKALQRFKVSEKTLMESNLNAARSCFLPDDEKKELINYLEEEYKKIHITQF